MMLFCTIAVLLLLGRCGRMGLERGLVSLEGEIIFAQCGNSAKAIFYTVCGNIYKLGMAAVLSGQKQIYKKGGMGDA